MKNVKIIENCSELGAGTRGASLGPKAMRIASLNANSDLFARIPSQEIALENELLYYPTETRWGKRIEGIATMYDRISETVAKVIKTKSFPIVLAGDHSSAGGTIAGIKIAKPQARLGAIWVDAHADIHSPYTTPSGNVHGMPVATALGMDNKECQVNDPDATTIEFWEHMKNLGHMNPKVLPQDLVFIALRDFEEPEAKLIERLNIKVIPVAEVREKGVKAVIDETMEHLNECSDIYLTFDVDSMDSSISKGTGTPVANGITVEEATGLITGFVAEPKICCLEFTEVNPTLDDKINKMAEIAFDVLEKTVDILEGGN